MVKWHPPVDHGRKIIHNFLLAFQKIQVNTSRVGFLGSPVSKNTVWEVSEHWDYVDSRPGYRFRPIMLTEASCTGDVTLKREELNVGVSKNESEGV